MRILLTAFSPFNGATENTSLAVVTNLAELLPNHKTQVLELPVAFANSHKVAISTAKQFRPDIILSFGEDATRNSINVETQAYNQQQATIPDNDQGHHSWGYSHHCHELSYLAQGGGG